MESLDGRRLLLILSGGIAAYKVLELIRRLRERGASLRCIMTQAATEFVTPLSVAALSGSKVYTDLFSLTDEAEMGHIRLSREADLVVVAPATADILARMAHGLADDLATTALLATDKPILVAPAMNPVMWAHPATQANIAILESRGVHRIGPGAGEMACGETGAGRLVEPSELLAAIETRLAPPDMGPLQGRRVLVTSGPTLEPIDPVRFLSNRSSGKQGHAIAAALAALGAEVVLVSGPVALPDPAGVKTVHVETAEDMLAACRAALPVAAAVCAAAVADWRPAERAGGKMKKEKDRAPPRLALTENPDILASLSAAGPARPVLVVGFAAETASDPEALAALAQAKRDRKGCDWILANDVSPGTETFGGEDNSLLLVHAQGVETWPRSSKADIARRLADRIRDTLGERS